MKMTAILVAALAVASCDRETREHGSVIAFGPTPGIAWQISAQFFPQTLPFSLFTTACGARPFFTPAFDLVLAQPQSVNFFLERVTFRMVDGTSLGGPSVTFPNTQLNSMFGSTLIVGSRAFSFRPQFGCNLTRPRSIFADVVLIDAFGSIRNISVNAPFQ